LSGLPLTPPRHQPAEKAHDEDWRGDQNGQEKRPDMEDFAEPMKKGPVGRQLAQTVKYVVQDGEYEKPNGRAQGQPQE